jgi:drug/metabolite transporter (DMT)-like permease
VLVLIGLYLVLAIETSGRLRFAAVALVCGLLLGVYVVVLTLPGPRESFELARPGVAMILAAIGGSVFPLVALALTDERFVPGPAPPAPART